MNPVVRYNREGDFAEWIREVEDIKSSADDDALKEDDVVPDFIDDEQDRAARFLKEVGFNALAHNVNEGAEYFDYLTKKQKQTLSRRIDTVRQKSKFHHTDVRNIFPQQISPENTTHYVDGPSLSVQQKPTKTPPKAPDRHPDNTKARKSPVAEKKEEFYIPPPDYFHITESLVQLGVEIARPHSGLSNDGRNEPSPSGGRVSPSPPAYTDQNFGRDSGAFVTRISDLGKKDLKMLRFIAAVELQTVFDENKITYMPQKSKRKAKDHGVYGVSLQTLLERDRKNFSPDCNVPLFLQQLIEHLEKIGIAEEGILRIPGAMGRMKEIRQDIDAKWPRGKFIFTEMMVHDTAGLLKQFLRDLPDSLLTFEKMEAFVKILDVPDEKRLYLLTLLIVMLPDVNRDTLQLLLSFLRKVIDDPDNRMILTSVAMIIAPNLFVVKTGRGTHAKPMNMEVELQMAERTSQLVMMMIENQDNFWTVPSDLLAQIRLKNETRRGGRFNIPVLVGKKDRSENYRATVVSVGSSSVQIHVSLENSSCETTVPITDTTTSNDVISQLLLIRSPKTTKKAIKSILSIKVEENTSNRKSDNSLSPSSTEASVLFEVGGNIGERRLDGAANMMSVVLINPNAKFVVRQRPT